MSNSGSTPRVLLIPDKPGWAIDKKARQIDRWLGGRYRIARRFKQDVCEEDLLAADLIVVFYWLEFADMRSLAEIFARRRDRLLIGICGHIDLDAERREPGLETLRTLARGVFALSQSLVREFAPLLEVPVFHTPNGVDTSFFCPPVGGRRRGPELCVGWAGSLSNAGPEHRGYHDLIVPAVAAVPDARVLSAIREERWRPAEEMPAFYHSLDAYVCASRSEGTPNPCLEAAACGVPLVTARVGAMPELVEDGVNGLFVERSVEDIAAKLTLLRESPELAARLSARMLGSIAAWDWEHRAKAYAALFDWALGESSAGSGHEDGAQKAELRRDYHGFDFGARAEALVNHTQVGAHRVHAEIERKGDVIVAMASGEEHQNLPLSSAEEALYRRAPHTHGRHLRRAAPRPPQDDAGSEWRHRRAAIDELVDGSRQSMRDVVREQIATRPSLQEERDATLVGRRRDDEQRSPRKLPTELAHPVELVRRGSAERDHDRGGPELG